MRDWQHDPDPFAQQCQATVDHLLMRNQWQLLARDELIKRTATHLRNGLTADARRAAMYTYCEALHMACSGSEGPQRQEQGYTELHRWLFDIARQRYPEDADEVAQRALVDTYTHFDRCKQPGAFLAFALQYLRTAVRTLHRIGKRETLPLVDTDAPDHASNRLACLTDNAPDVVIQVLAIDVRIRVAQLMARVVRRYPRAVLQLAAVWLKFIGGFDDQVISRRLKKPVKRIHELRALGLRRLRTDPQWRDLAIDLGIIPDNDRGEDSRQARGGKEL